MKTAGGRPRKPTNLKIIQGTFDPSRSAKNEPKPEIEAPPVPEEMGPEARKEWDRLVPDLLRLGLLSRIDRAALAAYCEAWADWSMATQEVEKRGMILRTQAGNFIENPYYTIKKRSAEIMHRFLVEFGMTPASRGRINAIIAETGSDPKEGRWGTFNE